VQCNCTGRAQWRRPHRLCSGTLFSMRTSIIRRLSHHRASGYDTTPLLDARCWQGHAGNRLCTATGKDGVFRIRREIAVDQRFVGSQLPPAGQAGISVQADVRTDRSRVRLAGAFFPGYWIFRVLPSCLTKPFLWFWRLTSSLEYVLAARRMPFAALATSAELPRYSAELK